MIRRLAATFVLVAGMLALSVHGLLAHEGHVHQILGTVTMAAPDHVMLKDKSGKDATVHVDAKTKVRRGGKPAQVTDITAGMRVAVGAVVVKEKGGEKWIARTIDLAAERSR